MDRYETTDGNVIIGARLNKEDSSIVELWTDGGRIHLNPYNKIVGGVMSLTLEEALFESNTILSFEWKELTRGNS